LFGLVLKRNTKKIGIRSLCKFHWIDWLSGTRKKFDFKEKIKVTQNPYYLYNNQGYLVYMSDIAASPIQLTQTQGNDPSNPDIIDVTKLIAPSPRVLRIMTKTFALWQDTWYYNRRQQEFGSVLTYLD
jgi:hypothetical protein